MKAPGRAFLLYCLFGVAIFAAATSAPRRPRLSGVAHMSLYASDLDRTRAFYRDFLGYQARERKNADGSLNMISFEVNDAQSIEVSGGLRPEMDRLKGIALRTDDAEALREYLSARGIKTPERVTQASASNANFEVRDADDHAVEFTQYEPGENGGRDQGKFLSDTRISTRILHLGILVGDVPAAMRFYAGALGLTEFWRGAARDSATASWINMRLPESEDYLEFMLYQELPRGDRRGSQHHICLEVPDIDQARARLEANPYLKSYTRELEVRTGINRRRQLNLFDPDGTRIELMEAHTVDGVPPPSTTLPLPRK